MAKKDKKVKNKRQRRSMDNPIKKKKRLNKRQLISIVTIVVVLFSSVFAYGFMTQIVIPTQLARSTPLSILVIGVDESKARDQWWEEGDKASLTDSLMVLTFNPEYYRFEVTSIPRDTSVDYTCKDIYELNESKGLTSPIQDQINEVYYMSGYDVSCLQDTVAEFLNIEVDYYAMLNFDQFGEIVDTLGGVTVTAHAADGTLTQANETTTETYSWTDGQEYTMMGDEALSYSRARHDSEKDYGRGIRQQQVVSSVLNTVLSGEGLSFQTMTALMGLVETDVPPKLAYEYYKFLTLTEEVGQMISDDKKITELVLPTDAWEYMFDWYEYKDPSGGSVSVDDANAFKEWLKTTDDVPPITSYFFNQHQFFNEAYSGHYNVVPEQLLEISNALRGNLGMDLLTMDTLKIPSNPYGDNEANGMIPTAWATGGSSSGSGGGTYIPESEPAPTAPQEDTQSEPEPTPDPDSDGDGIPDSQDAYPYDPNNGVTQEEPAVEEPETPADEVTPEPEPPETDPEPPETELDSDGDGVPDTDDAFPLDPDKWEPDTNQDDSTQ